MSNTINITVHSDKPGKEISPTFTGVSYETETMLPNDKGARYFSPDNKALIAEFKALGIRSLRVGANTVDDNKVAMPTESDIDALFAFAMAAGAKVIYSTRLKNGDPKAAATTAKYIQDHYAESLDCFAIGNEPSDFVKHFNRGYNYDWYRSDWKRIMEAMVAAVPGARFSGPDTNPNPEWAGAFVRNFADSGHLALLTAHLYPGGCSYSNPGSNPGESVAYKDLIPLNTTDARRRMLSPEWHGIYAEVLTGLTDVIAGKGIPYRLTECNSFWYGGLNGASNTYASALWSLDYLHWWATNGCNGVNFHTGDMVHGPIPCRYAVFVTSEHGYHTRPLGYGLKTFDLGGHGFVLPVTIDKHDKQNLTAYASVDERNTLNVTLINKGSGENAAGEEVHLNVAFPSAFGSAQAISLTAPNGDISATSGVMLGGAPIGEDGSWKGNWTPLPASADGRNGVTVKVAPASATVIRAQTR